MNNEHKKIFSPTGQIEQTPSDEEILENKAEYLRAREQINERINKETEEILSDSMNLG